jgi:hypothetical protein
MDADGKLASSVLGFVSDHDASHVKDAEMRADAAKRRLDAAKGDGADATELLRKALEFYKDYEAAKDAARSAAIHRA